MTNNILKLREMSKVIQKREILLRAYKYYQKLAEIFINKQNDQKYQKIAKKIKNLIIWLKYV